MALAIWKWPLPPSTIEYPYTVLKISMILQQCYQNFTVYIMDGLKRIRASFYAKQLGTSIYKQLRDVF